MNPKVKEKMTLEKIPFVNYTLEGKKKADIFTIRLNEQERKNLNQAKLVLEQPKDSTAFKALALIGQNVIHDPKIAVLLRVVFKNKKNNKLQGIVEFEQKD